MAVRYVLVVLTLGLSVVVVIPKLKAGEQSEPRTTSISIRSATSTITAKWIVLQAPEAEVAAPPKPPVEEEGLMSPSDIALPPTPKPVEEPPAKPPMPKPEEPQAVPAPPAIPQIPCGSCNEPVEVATSCPAKCVPACHSVCTPPCVERQSRHCGRPRRCR